MTKREAAKLEPLVDRIYRTTLAVISRHDRDNFLKALRSATIAVCVSEGLDPAIAKFMYERAEEMALSPELSPRQK